MSHPCALGFYGESFKCLLHATWPNRTPPPMQVYLERFRALTSYWHHADVDRNIGSRACISEIDTLNESILGLIKSRIVTGCRKYKAVGILVALEQDEIRSIRVVASARRHETRGFHAKHYTQGRDSG